MLRFSSITPEQYERLPQDLSEVVALDRELDNIRDAKVCDFIEFKKLKALRAEAAASAKDKWGYQARGDGNTAPA